MSIEETTNYLIKNRFRVPIIREMNIVNVHNGDVPSIAKVNEIDLQKYASEIHQYISNLQREKNELRSTLKELAINDYNIHWSRELKREILEIYFQSLIKELPYYSGGDLK